ncbi:probable carbohydrate esterase At4g34215 [Triticum urartu]|uniref:Sialate O-acetylesterase domain-containing protein n=1 Tax=Triticum urartu TaxID=4572 RepID=A0A8R7QYR3_TRIUA|nr:probable carbohydrate esterase At4g34215 [Triticum urartu]
MEPAAATMLSRPRVLPILLAVFALLAAAVTVSARGGAERAPTLVFILAGQSNMGGRGGATVGNRWDGVVPPECAPSPRTLRLSPSLRWEEAREPLHAGVDAGNVVGVGPGMPFAHALLRSPACPRGAVVGLVPCAQGGTPIANWSRGTEMYERMVTRARVAGAGTGRIAALLWFQGEADTLRREDALAYAGRMEAFVRDVRRDLALPNLLVIQVGIATAQWQGNKQGKWLDLVRKQQRAVRVANLKYVDAMGLPLANDITHLTTQAQVRLGKMLADAYIATL